MRVAAESLRIALIASQAALLVWMVASGLWRRLPLWCAWLASEVVSRVLFRPTGGYWHSMWLPLQPTVLFLLVAAAIEARWQAQTRLYTLGVAALMLAPASISLDLSHMAGLRLLVHAGVAVALLGCDGSTTALWHARVMAILAATTAAAGWVPATGVQWWRMRVLYMAVALACTATWAVLFTRSSNPRTS